MSAPNNNDLFLMRQLQDILLKEDRTELDQLRSTIDDPEKLSQKVTPIIEARIDFLKKNFPKEFRVVVDDIVDKRIKSSQHELMDALYPVMGQMIKKYINFQFQVLKESIEESVKQALDTKTIWWKIKANVFGIKQQEVILQNLDRPTVEEVCLIQRDSGLLMGAASLSPAVDKDVIAGMLTAIKAFVEDAFQRENEELEMIQYGTYKILLYNFHTYYVSVAMSGSVSSEEKEKINDELQHFALNELNNYKQSDLDEKYDLISQKLHDYFIAPQKENTPDETNRFVEKTQAIVAAYD